MPDLEENNKNDFIIEKIKERPVNKNRLVRRTLVTAFMAVLFGLIACFTFLLLEPVISDILYPQEDPPSPVIQFPEDQEEMSPEEMLSDTMLGMQQLENQQTEETNEEEIPPETTENLTLEQEQINQILDSFVMDKSNYRELYNVMSDYLQELNQNLVTVTGISSETDLLLNNIENENITWGVIVASSNRIYYILTDYDSIDDAERLAVTFSNRLIVDAALKQYDPTTKLAVLMVDLTELQEEEYLEGIKVASLGSSYMNNIVGVPVVAMGSPMGVNESVGYGMITSFATTLSMVDGSYKLITTDIYGSRKAGGVLFNLQNEVVGIITDDHRDSNMPNIINAFGISDLKALILKMVNSTEGRLPYMGIRGMSVSMEANRELGVPMGAYVTDVEMNSPAMAAGIQQGDILTAIGDQIIGNYSSYSTTLLNFTEGQEVNVTVYRQSQEEYREMDLTVIIGGVGKEE